MDSKPIKRKMTDKQKAARNINLEKARAKRAEMANHKKSGNKSSKKDDIDISSDDSAADSFSDDSSSSEAFTISKTKKTKPTQSKLSKSNRQKQPKNSMQGEVDDLKSMIIELANMQKKQNKNVKKQSQRSLGGGNTTINLPPNISQAIAPVMPSSRQMDPYLESMRKSIFE